MPDRRRQRQQRVRHDAGGSQNPVGASNREPEQEKTTCNNNKTPRPSGSGVAYAEPKEYESVTIMPDKEVAEPQKYRRPGVLSNWSRYEEISTDDIEEGEDYLIGEDFSLVLEQQASSGGFMQLRGESNWEEDEAGILASHGLGVLHVADLVSAINTLPLYTQLNIPEDSLPESILEYYSHLAEDNKKLYKPNNSAYNECLDINSKIIQSLKISDSEPLELTSEEPTTNQSTRNAVDVAMSLSDAFDQVPEDVDLSTFIQEPAAERQSSPLKQPSPARQQNPTKSFTKQKPFSKEEPLEIQQHTLVDKPIETPEDKPICILSETDPGNKVSIQRNEKNSMNFDFGLPKKESSVTVKGSIKNHNVSKVKTPSSIDVKDVLNVEGSFVQEDKKSPEGPAVDLDAPGERSKPVLLVSKTEAEDLEDWLDSMLDD